MKKMLLLAVLSVGTTSFAQTATPAVPAPAKSSTTLDAFLEQTGVLTIRESLGTKSVPVDYGASLSLEAVKIYSPGKENEALKGIRIGVNDGEKYSSMRYEFIEMSEIDGMIKAAEYMVGAIPKLNPSVSPEMKFTSKSEAQFGLFYSSYDKQFSGFARAGSETAYMKTGSIEAMRQALIDLKALLK